MGWMENGILLKKGKVFKGIGEDPKFCRMKYSKWCLSTHSRFTISKKNLGQLGFKRNNSTVATNSSTALVQSSEAQVTGWLWGKNCFGVQPCQKSHGFPAKQAWHNHNQHNLIHFSRKDSPVTKIQLNTFQPYCPPFFLNPWKSLVGSRSCPFGNFHLAPFCPQKTLDVTWLIYQNSYN